MTYRDAIKDSLEKLDSDKSDIPMCFPYLLMSFTLLLNGVSAMYIDKNNPMNVTIAEITNVIGGSNLLPHTVLCSGLYGFIKELLDNEIPENTDPMWYDAESIISLWNEYVERNSSLAEKS